MSEQKQKLHDFKLLLYRSPSEGWNDINLKSPGKESRPFYTTVDTYTTRGRTEKGAGP